MAHISFFQTRRTAHWLAEKMSSDGHAVALLSGDLDITQRAAVINRFREVKEKVLITTNVSARGIMKPDPTSRDQLLEILRLRQLAIR